MSKFGITELLINDPIGKIEVSVLYWNFLQYIQSSIMFL